MKYVYIILILIFGWSWLQIRKLPEVDRLVTKVFRAPVQTETTRAEFDFTYRGTEYKVEPQADYELWGLVVSVNNIYAWYNYYHDENSVNLKDVCVIWGENASSGVYREKGMKFYSGEWTCYYKWTASQAGRFNPFKLSNNHLLAADPNIQEAVRDIRVGDQIRLKGALVDYAEAGSGWYRRTSLSREDTNQSSRSGGACEVFYVDEIETLRKNQAFWNFAHTWSKRLFLFILIGHFLYFLFRPVFLSKIPVKQVERAR